MTTKTLTLDGAKIIDISTFYEEINRVFMSQENWKISASLDALDDMLYGSYGAIQGKEPVVLIWRNIKQSRANLGTEATYAHYQAKLQSPHVFNQQWIHQKLEGLKNDTEPTFFEIVLEIISAHPNIKLVAQEA